MTIDEAIKHLERKVRQNVFQVDPEAFEALRLGIEALKAIQKMRHYPFPDEILKLPGEDPLPSPPLSPDEIKRLRESPLAERPGA